MAVVTITGGPGAPGVTSAALALLLTWPLTDGRRVLLLEADPDGGSVLAGALQGQVEAGSGLRNLAVADRRGRLLEAMWEESLDVSPGGTGDRLLLPGLTDPAQSAALAYTWGPLAQACASLEAYGCDVIVDLGRSGGLGPAQPMVRQADSVLVVLRSTLRGLSAARPRTAALAADLAANAGGADTLGLLLVQEGPYSGSEIASALSAPVVGVLPFAPKEARVLSDGGRTADRRFQRSQLMRAARTTADHLRALAARRRTRVPTTTPTQGEPPTPHLGTAMVPAPAFTGPPQAAQVGPGHHPGLAMAAPVDPRAAMPPTVYPAPSATSAVAQGFGPASAGHTWPVANGVPDQGGAFAAHAEPAAGIAGHVGGGYRGPSTGGYEQQAPTGATGFAGHDRPAAPAAGADGYNRPRAMPTVAPATQDHQSEPRAWTVREVLELAASAQLGVEPESELQPESQPAAEVPPLPNGMTRTPGQAARLQAVRTEPVAPPLALHVPRPPVPSPFPPAPADQPDWPDPGNEEVTRVR